MKGEVGLVCFDWGGVILRICRSWKEACARAGLVYHAELEEPGRTAARRELSEAYQVGRVGGEAFFRAMAETTEGRYSATDVQRVHDAWLIEEYPGVDPVLKRLRAAGVVTGLLSNTNERHWARQRPGMHGQRAFGAVLNLTHRHASHIMGLAKPSREIYERFASEVGVRPGRVLFFDDLVDNVEAARGAGWRAERIDPDGDTASQIEAALQRYGVG
ncbi:MAG: HAD-IA family hydrolase [Phycisphaerales bacterium]|nr:HAD-IA family hydrolase [Phycisphaerales bacterium]